MPQVFAEAKKNLKNPPRIYTEIALEQIDGLVSFFQNDVPSAFKDANDAADAGGVCADRTQAVIDALKSYGAWMKTDLLPRSNGDFRLGADTFRKKLAYDEMVDIPLDQLLQIGVCGPAQEPGGVRAGREGDRSDEDAAARCWRSWRRSIRRRTSCCRRSTTRFDSEIAFIRAHHIITIPSDVQPTLEETPPFMRATTQASMDPPGPFETHSTKAYFNVTLPETELDGGAHCGAYGGVQCGHDHFDERA